MKKILFIIISIYLFGCSTVLVNTENIEKLTLINNNTKKVIKEYKNSAKIESIIKVVNSATRKPIKFYSTHKINIYQKNGEVLTILINGKSIKFEGITYTLKREFLKAI